MCNLSAALPHQHLLHTLRMRRSTFSQAHAQQQGAMPVGPRCGGSQVAGDSKHEVLQASTHGHTASSHQFCCTRMGAEAAHPMLHAALSIVLSAQLLSS